MLTITSTQNDVFKSLHKIIEDKKYRLESQSFWCDGANFVYQAMERGWEIEKLIYVEECIDSDFKRGIINKVNEDKHIQFSEKLYSHFSTKKNIQGIGAIIKQKYLENTLLKGAGIVLENISNPGNLGTIIRNCVAFGIENVYIINPSVDPFNIETVRASMSGIFFVNISIFSSIEKFSEEIQNIKNNDDINYLCIGTALSEDTINLKDYIKKYPYTSKDNILIIFGSEAKGMTDSSKKICKDLLKIEIRENIDSLNIAESTAIILYELFK